MRSAMGLGLALWGALGAAGSAPPAAARPVPAVVRPRLVLPDSVLRGPLPFAPGRPGDSFAASDLTRKYARNITPFLKPEAVPGLDLAQIDRAAAGVRQVEPQAAPPDSSDLRLTEEQRRRVAEIPPEERDQLDPPKPGVHVGVPSAVATTGALLGGIGLLIKVLSELVR
jgi:hypothetical protein